MIILVLVNSCIAFFAYAQTPIKLKLIGAFWDSTGYSFDTLYFGFHKDAGPGVQEGLDILDTSTQLKWGTYDTSTPSLRYKNNIREFEPFTYTAFQIYAKYNLVYIKWDTAEYQPSFYNYDFKQLNVSIECDNAFFEFPERESHPISGRPEQWKETNGVNPIDSVRIFIIGSSPQLRIGLGVKDSIPTSLRSILFNPKIEIFQSTGSNLVYIENPNELPLKLSLLNNLGQTLASFPTTHQLHIKLPLEGFTYGLYYLSLVSENHQTLKKIIIP
ncbi:MAG: hypothetical protein FGM41_00935 [Bacteroidetes bacterium]|nr:hypothetical protein [Bacteroidota bacterium]